jgi:hypothetical protein
MVAMAPPMQSECKDTTVSMLASHTIHLQMDMMVLEVSG